MLYEISSALSYTHSLAAMQLPISGLFNNVTAALQLQFVVPLTFGHA